MSLRTRLALAFAVMAVAVAALMGVIGYSATANQLERSVDQSLLNMGGRMMDGPGDRDRDRDNIATVLSADGQVVQSVGEVQIPVTDADREAAASTRSYASARTQTIDGQPYRVVTVSAGDGRGALLMARDWSESAAVLQRLALVLLVCALVLASIAAFVGWWFARRITRRLIDLTHTAGEVSQTGRLDLTVPGGGKDEVGRLAASFNAMLGRLAASQADQQRLVQDAGHELRTPLTSLRTNISLLERFDDLTPEVRERVLADLKGESRELTGLVNEVLTLAGGQGGEGEPAPVTLSAIVKSVATRARRRTGREVTLSTDDSVVVANAAGLERAVWNLVENAAKFDTDAGPIDITVADGVVEVLDRGPGVPAEEMPHVFDRFYRPVSSRSMPGSGLGLAIVKDVAEQAGGRVYVRAREGGGSVFGIALPVQPPLT
ncbi:MAG: HAMP domain-containing histidine kinase [Candidatus Nanopelagicales bacterium]|jgi:two-component system sensor histidine kinase MprB|nr:HAMP domain-containing histidine kinase [Candidatus Nanopelagicales bacterium]